MPAGRSVEYCTRMERGQAATERRQVRVPRPARAGFLRRRRRDPLDQQVTELIGELTTRSTDFSTRWAKHQVRRHPRGRKVVHHPAVGTTDLAYDDFALPGGPHVSITAYTADPGTPSAMVMPCTAAAIVPH
jgi:hypothetical protein